MVLISFLTEILCFNAVFNSLTSEILGFISIAQSTPSARIRENLPDVSIIFG